jgi:hypothetical protein
MLSGGKQNPKKGARARTALIAAAIAVAAYVFVFHFPRGGLRTGFGTYSGTYVPSEARGLTNEQRQEETRARAEQIRVAALAFMADTGSAPTTVSSLVPKYLAEVPRPLVSTKPFWITRGSNPRGFNVHWEAWPNAWYETYWIDEKGEKHADM